MPGITVEMLAIYTFLMGTIIGSFLNVVIWRLPRKQSLVQPASHCPNCNRPLSAWENVPLFSFLLLRAKCRTCKAPITWRYFGVELFTGLAFLALFLHFGTPVDTIAYCLFMAALISAFFIDLELFIIPDEINTFALLVGIGRDVWGILAGDPSHALLWGWLPRSIFGAMVCAGIFVLIQIIGQALFRKDAMGDGDVKLARAIGALLPLKLALSSFLMAIAIGAVVGCGLIALHAMRRPKADEPEAEDEEDEELTAATPFTEVLLFGLIYITFADLFIWLGSALRIPAAVRLMGEADTETVDEDDDFHPGPTHVPFGPFMAIGAFLAVFVGQRLIDWYMSWSGLANLAQK